TGMSGLTIRDVVADTDDPKYEKSIDGEFNPPDGGSGRCVLRERDLGNGDDAAFKKAPRDHKPWNDGLTEITKLRALVREFNEERARIAFGEQAVRVAQDSH